MSTWIPICHSRDVDREPKRHKLKDGSDVVIVRSQEGKVLAMSNRCPHKAASLHRSGDIEDMGGEHGLCLRCPKHKGKFGGGLFVSFKTGKCVTRNPCSKSDEVAKWSVLSYVTKEAENTVFIRLLKPSDDPATRQPAAAAEPVAVRDEEASLPATVSSIHQVSPDCHVFTLRLLHKADRGLFSGPMAAMWHIWLRVSDVSREYTPISSSADTAASGKIDLVIKIYDNGRMSEKLPDLRVDDQVMVSAPRTTLHIPELETPDLTSGLHFYLFAGGTGIAPCLQLLRRAQAVGSSASLLYSTWTADDVLLGAELEALASSWCAPNDPRAKLSLSFLLTRESSERRAPKRLRKCTAAVVCGRRVDMELVEQAMMQGEAAHTAITIISGPSGFNEHCETLVRPASGFPDWASHRIYALDA